MAGIGLYQALRRGYVSPCRFYPSCSTYAAEAIATHGAAKGTWLAVRRIASCRPGGRSGYDPVPDPDPGTGATR
ncbi:MAG: membrane protein insertion efficiency factor YidD [Actinomycetota bacterium]|nr:membrane protein insertion efficiency factor YidD [Actinomycetota bacterium]